MKRFAILVLLLTFGVRLFCTASAGHRPEKDADKKNPPAAKGSKKDQKKERRKRNPKRRRRAG